MPLPAVYWRAAMCSRVTADCFPDVSRPFNSEAIGAGGTHERRRSRRRPSSLGWRAPSANARARLRSVAPRGTTLELLEQVRGVLDEYEDYLPLTIRQIFYRLVGAHNYEKTERAYARLCEHLNRARRARIIPMASIRDDGGVSSSPVSWDSAEQFMRTIREMAADFTLDHSAGQKTRLVVDCEATGMVPQLERVAHPFGVTVISSGGFDSTTERHRFAAGLADHDRPTEVLDIGDHDPSGAHKFLAMMEDIQAFTRELGGEVTFTRLAVTPAQITQFGLETAPPKATDKRAFRGRTCQAEALAPDVLASILRDAIEARIDGRAYARVLARERSVRRDLLNRLRE